MATSRVAPEVPDGQSHNLSPLSTRAARASPSNSITSSVSDIEAAASFSGADGLVHSWTLRFLSADVEALYLRHLGVYRSVDAVGLYLVGSLMACAAFSADLFTTESGGGDPPE